MVAAMTQSVDAQPIHRAQAGLPVEQEDALLCWSHLGARLAFSGRKYLQVAPRLGRYRNWEASQISAEDRDQVYLMVILGTKDAL